MTIILRTAFERLNQQQTKAIQENEVTLALLELGGLRGPRTKTSGKHLQVIFDAVESNMAKRAPQTIQP